RYSFVHNPPRSCVIPGDSCSPCLWLHDFPQLQKQPLASQCCTNISCLHICFEPINLSCSIKADLVLLICPRFCVKPVCIWYCLSASGTACLHLVLPVCIWYCLHYE
ncbi:hypothetical protein NDU88_000533, partial [Pleurodeles waltl]